MTGMSADSERCVVIANRYGLHARPAAEFVKLATKFRSSITVRKDDIEVNGKSIMGIMMLAAEYGSEIAICAEGDDAAAALDALERLVTTGFGEH
jgi:phosphocarrier protein HPr